MRFWPIRGFIRRVLRSGIGERLPLVAFEAVPAAQSDTTQAGSVAILGIPDRKTPERRFKGTNPFGKPALLYAKLCGTKSLCLLLVFGALLYGDSNTTITGTVTDPSNRAVPGAEIQLQNLATLAKETVTTNSEGVYEASALSVGAYRMRVMASGFRLYTVERLTTQVARILVQDVQLELGDVSQEVTVTSRLALIDRATTSVGHLVDGRTVQDAPLNGRYFLV